MRNAPFVSVFPGVTHVRIDNVPIMTIEREQAAHVNAETFNHIVVGQGQLLDHVAQLRLDRRQAQERAQVVISHNMDARDLCAAQVERDTVGFLVIERCQQPLP